MEHQFFLYKLLTKVLWFLRKKVGKTKSGNKNVKTKASLADIVVSNDCTYHGRRSC